MRQGKVRGCTLVATRETEKALIKTGCPETEKGQPGKHNARAVRRAWFYAPARRRAFVELPLEDYQPGDEHMCVLLRYSMYGRRRTKLGGRACIDTQRSQVDERDRVPVRAARAASWVNVSCNLHGDDITNWWRTIGSGMSHQK